MFQYSLTTIGSGGGAGRFVLEQLFYNGNPLKGWEADAKQGMDRIIYPILYPVPKILPILVIQSYNVSHKLTVGASASPSASPSACVCVTTGIRIGGHPD